MAHSLAQSIVLMSKRQSNMANLSQKFFAKNQNKYHVIGLTRLWTDVYWKFSQGDYERTKALLNSFKTELITDGMKLFLNETDEIAANKPGQYQYYPSYVSLGLVWGPTAGSERNITTGWKEALKDVLIKDFAKEVDRTVVRVV